MNRYAVLLAALVVASPTVAQRGGLGRGSSADVWKFLADRYDKNGDGKITAEEHNRGAEKFAGFDRDGNGSITEADFSGGSSGRRRGGGGRSGGRRGGGPGVRGPSGPATSTVGIDIATAIAKSADDNEDGKVTKIEWTKSLTTLDHDHDKIVSAEELNDIMCTALGRKKLSDRAVGRRSRHLDTNKDGKVQLAELASMFAKLDKNSDQSISKLELGSAQVRQSSGPPRVGQVAPDFELPFVKDGKKTVRLSSFAGKKPVALIFGSYT